MNQKEKTKFRQSAKWKKFRAFMKSKNKVDFITERPLYKGFQCHHIDQNPDHYTNLKEEMFVCLNRQTHEVVHWLARYDNYVEIANRLIDLVEKMRSTI